MAKNHVEIWDVQERESVQKGQWLKEFLNSSDPVEHKSSFVKDTPENYLAFFLSYPKQTQEKFGLVNDVKYLRYQYYKPFSEFKEQLVLNYEVTFDKERKALINLSLNNLNEITIMEIF
jgi:hypothetical protein